MSTYKVDRDVPPPGTYVSRATGVKATLLALEVNDSILVENASQISSIQNAMSRLNRESEFRFISRSEDGGRRIWRVK